MTKQNGKRGEPSLDHNKKDIDYKFHTQINNNNQSSVTFAAVKSKIVHTIQATFEYGGDMAKSIKQGSKFDLNTVKPVREYIPMKVVADPSPLGNSPTQGEKDEYDRAIYEAKVKRARALRVQKFEQETANMDYEAKRDHHQAGCVCTRQLSTRPIL